MNKPILILILSLLSIAPTIKAQDRATQTDTLSLAHRVDSLENKLKYMETQLKYIEIKAELNELRFDITTEKYDCEHYTHELEYYSLRKMFRYELWYETNRLYKNSVKSKELFSDRYDILKTRVLLIGYIYDFTKDQQDYLDRDIKIIKFALDSYESYLKVYKLTLDNYYSKVRD